MVAHCGTHRVDFDLSTLYTVKSIYNIIAILKKKHNCYIYIYLYIFFVFVIDIATSSFHIIYIIVSKYTLYE